MTREFYGATLKAEHSINKLLSLPASGREQDWEFELADPNRIGEMLDAALNNDLNYDEKCALALIVIASIEERVQSGSEISDIIDRARYFIRKDKDVLEAMKFYWIDLERASEKVTIREILLV